MPKFSNQDEANRYVYAIVSKIMTHELYDCDGWIFGGIEEESDIKRLKWAIETVRRQLERKAWDND